MNKTRQSYRIILQFLMALALLSGLLAVPKLAALAQAPSPIPMKNTNTTLSISSANPVVQPGDAFDLTVTIESDTQSRGAQCAITFDPTLVEVSGVSEGTFYKQWAQANGAQTVMVPSKPTIDNQKGQVQVSGIGLVGSPGKGPTGSGSLLVIHAKAKSGVSGTANFSLSNLEVDDTGDASGRTQMFAGVKVQNGTVAIGNGAAAPAQPTAQAVVQATTASSGANPAVEPTIARIDTNRAGSNIPWIVILPAIGVVLAGVVVFTSTRKRK